MTIEEFCTRLAARLAAAPVADARLELAAREIGGFFGVQPHEVAFFTVDARQSKILFRWPQSLAAAAAHIPLKGVNSLVAKTANERCTTIDNAFAASRHLFMFEHLLAEKEERVPMQKVMSVPVVTGDAVRGVIQLARKGATPEEAGADFTPADLAALERIAAVGDLCAVVASGSTARP